MRLDIRYCTRFDYANPVRESANELRACPTTDDRQQLVSYRVTTSPPTRVLSTVDYWGTRVDAFTVREPHLSLEIVAESVVETRPSAPPGSEARLADLESQEFLDRHVEYLAPTAHVRWGPGVEEAARRVSAAAGDAVVDVVHGVHDAVGSLSYVSGATYVGVAVEDVLERREGVCQDFAHLAIAMCRSLKIPARYVSGYLFAVDDATGEDTGEETVHVQTHAWLEAALPDGGWIALDPTNSQEVGERHVRIGHGRDYDDVLPLKGVFSGPPAHDLTVAVEMRRATVAQQQ